MFTWDLLYRILARWLTVLRSCDLSVIVHALFLADTMCSYINIEKYNQTYLKCCRIQYCSTYIFIRLLGKTLRFCAEIVLHADVRIKTAWFEVH